MVASTKSTGALLLLLILHLPTTVIGGCTKEDNTWKASKDCTSYYWCSWGVVGQFYNCVHSELFDETTNTCVNPDKTNFQCPGLNWREDDPEGAEVVGHTTTLAGSLVNPNKMYCSTDYIGQYHDGECGEQACPSGLDGECPGNQRCYMMMNCQEKLVVETPPPAPAVDPDAVVDFGNPGNWYCSSLWNPPEYTGPCGYPCPNTSDEACPSGQKCFANQPNCQDQGLKFMGWMTLTLDEVATTATTEGAALDDTAASLTTSDPTSSSQPTITPRPTNPPTTAPPTPPPSKPPTNAPTEDTNPNNAYCKNGWDGECGKPCPTGFNNECDNFQYCFQHQTDCKAAEVEKAEKGAQLWCGKTFDDMSERCHKQCPNGTDEECDSGEKCFADSQCGSVGTKADAEAKLAAAQGKMWCGTSYKNLVENCPKECPNGTDEECGEDMTCFNMSDEEVSCSKEGVGIKPKVDPANLWCGETWIHMLENCPKACPEGSDEECGPGLTCFDMSSEDKICLYVGYGVKEKDDPEKRFCGETFSKMLESCPARCRSGSNDECPSGMQCFGNSECVYEGVGVVAAVESDPSTMYCGSKFEDAAKCSTPCPSGGTDGECPSGESCYADVICGSFPTVETTVSKPVEEKVVEEEPVEEKAVEEKPAETTPVEEKPAETTPVEEKPAETTPVEEKPAEATPVEEKPAEATPAEEKPAEEKESDPSTMYCGSAFEDASKCSTPCPSGGEGDCPSGESCFADVTCKVIDPSTMYCGSKFDDASKCSTPCPSGGTEGECPSGESCYADVICGKTTTDVEADDTAEETKESETENPSSKAEIFLDMLEDESQPAEDVNVIASTETEQASPFPLPQEPEDTSNSSLVVENIEVILYGMTELTSAHVYSFETNTATYLEEFYNTDSSTNNAVRDSVNNLDTSLDVHRVEGPSRRNLRSRRTLVSDGYRLTYSQKISYDADLTISLEQVLEYPLSSSARRNDYVAYLKAQDPRLFSSLSAVSAVILTDDMFIEDSTSFTSSSDKFKGFKCHNTGVECPSGECNAGDICMYFAPESDVASSQQAPIHEPGPDASIILDSVLETEADSILETEAIENGPVSSDSSTRHGLTDVYGKIVIHGTNLVVAEHLKNWETFTSVYVQNFYNNEHGSMDYVQSNVNNVQAKIEMQSVEFGTAEVKTTTINFKIPISWETRDDSISFITIVSQPFMTKDYRQKYIEHMKSYLPGTFSVVTDVSGVIVESQSDVTTSEYEVSNTFFCGAQWPVDCSSATRCNHADDCPSSQGCFVSSGCLASEPEVEVEVEATVNESTVNESTAEVHSAESAEKTLCSLCRIDQVISSYNEVTFNRKAINCADAYDFIADLEEGSPTCVSAKEALGGDCCVALDDSTTNTNSTPVVLIEDNPQPVVINTIDTSESSKVGSASTTDTATAAVINDKWTMNHASQPAAEESEPQEENKKKSEYADYAWFGEWENFKMQSSSCTLSRSVSTATVIISLIVVEMILA